MDIFMRAKMRYSKLLIMSASLFTTLSYATCTGTACFNQGVDFGNQTKPSSDSISNSVLESAVGTNNITQAKAAQDAIQSTMGNDYKNIDGITNSGNNKAQACIGKDTAECKAYNYYNDPLTKLSQQGIESAVGVASNLINKKIEQNVSLTDYCAQHPSDSICKMCKDDPSQSMCQSGNKCTTISYNTGDSKYVTNGCQIIGQRGYNCSKWVDSIDFHTTPPSPADGTVLASGVVQTSLKPYSYINTAASISANLSMTAYSDLTMQNVIKLTGTVSSYPNNNCGTDTKPINLNISFNQSQSTIYSLNYPSGFRCQTEGGSNLVIKGGCVGDICSYLFTATTNGHYANSYTDKTEIKTMTFSFTKPKAGSNEKIIDKITWKDNCTK